MLGPPGASFSWPRSCFGSPTLPTTIVETCGRLLHRLRHRERVRTGRTPESIAPRTLHPAKWPGLHYCTTAFAPRHYPEEIVKYANTRSEDKILYCGSFPAGIDEKLGIS